MIIEYIIEWPVYVVVVIKHESKPIRLSQKVPINGSTLTCTKTQITRRLVYLYVTRSILPVSTVNISEIKYKKNIYIPR